MGNLGSLHARLRVVALTVSVVEVNSSCGIEGRSLHREDRAEAFFVRAANACDLEAERRREKRQGENCDGIG